MEELRRKGLWTWAMILCFFSLGMIFFADFFGSMMFYAYFCRKVKFLILYIAKYDIQKTNGKSHKGISKTFRL